VVTVGDQTVAGVIVAAPGMKMSDVEDRLAIDVLDTILSGYYLPSGWLHEELRSKRLVYLVHAYNWPGLAPGAFITIAACQPDDVSRVIAIIRDDLHKAAGYLPTQQEVDEAVNVILTAEMLENQSAAALAMSSALDELYGLGYDWRRRMAARYRAVTPRDVRNVGAKYLGGGLVTVVTTPRYTESVPAPPGTRPTATSQATTQPTSPPISHPRPPAAVTQPTTEAASGPTPTTGASNAPR
jgi:zinc protease